MKKLILLGALVLMLLVAPSVYAEEGTPSDTGPKPLPVRLLDKKEDRHDALEDRRDKMEDRRDAATSTGVWDKREDIRDKREDLRDKSEDLREKGRENAISRIKAHLGMYHRILEAAINRMEKLAERIEARIAKMKADGTDTTEAEGFVATAHTELDAAADDLAEIKANADASVTVNASTTPATVFGPTHELMKSAREHIGNAWKALKDAVQSLKETSN